ncbi:hypothetical protein ASG90_02495 [Nocardioides sp. Soil797]|nr:hypothetical protein ASG90_02495 [Nocardioides sp. Soil797]
MSVRVYVPVTAAALAELVEQGRLPGPLDAHAVTDELRASWPDGDDEQWEYAALAAAADEAWQARGSGALRRHVVAADVASVEPREDREGEVTGVRVVGDLVWKRVAAAHVDTDDLVSGPDPDGGPELAWFATQEISTLL